MKIPKIISVTFTITRWCGCLTEIRMSNTIAYQSTILTKPTDEIRLWKNTLVPFQRILSVKACGLLEWHMHIAQYISTYLCLLWNCYLRTFFDKTSCLHYPAFSVNICVKLEAHPLSDPAQIDIFLQGLNDISLLVV